MPKDVYERVRADATHFLLRPGHEDPTMERVIETHESYVVVEKEGRDVERVVEQTDPRSGPSRRPGGRRRAPASRPRCRLRAEAGSCSPTWFAGVASTCPSDELPRARTRTLIRSPTVSWLGEISSGTRPAHLMNTVRRP